MKSMFFTKANNARVRPNDALVKVHDSGSFGYESLTSRLKIWNALS